MIEDDSALNYEETSTFAKDENNSESGVTNDEHPSSQGHFSETESTTNKDVLYDQEAVESSIFESTTLRAFKRDDVRLEKIISAKNESATKEETRFFENRERSNATTLVSGREISSSAKDVLTRGNSIHLNTENNDKTHTSATHLKNEINSYNEKGFLSIRKNGRWGKLCLSGMDDLLEERQAAWTIEDLGRAVCKAITYQ